MAADVQASPTEISGVSYFYPEPGSILAARDGKVSIPLSGFPLPLLKDDAGAGFPSYDAVGRGIYYLLRANPEAHFAAEYAQLLKEAYPHLLAELATHLVMLDKKDVDLPYLDRKIACLKIFSLIESDNHRFPYEIGLTYTQKGMTLAALARTTLHFFAAEKHLRRALELAPVDCQTLMTLGEVCFILGKYRDASSCWEKTLELQADIDTSRIRRKLAQISSGETSPVPPIDYLQAVGVALEAYESGDFEEAAAIIVDVIDAVAQFDDFPVAEMYYLLGLCYVGLDIPKTAEDHLRRALQIRPGYEEVLSELHKLGVA